MSENDSTDGARLVNCKPLLVRGAIYTREQVIGILGISAHTLNDWKAAGLPVHQHGTKQAFIVSDDLFELFARLANPKPKGTKK